AKDNQESPCHIFAEKRTGGTADHQDRALLHILLHVNAAPVPDAVPDIYPAAPHAVGCRITGTPVDDHLALVHRVARRMVSVAVDNDGRAAHEHRKVAARDTVHRDRHVVPPEAIPDKALAEHIIDYDLLCTIADCFPDLLVERRVVQVICVDMYCYHRSYSPTDFTSSTLSSPSSSI